MKNLSSGVLVFFSVKLLIRGEKYSLKFGRVNSLNLLFWN